MHAPGLFVVMADFLVLPEHAEDFARLIGVNAEASRTREAGCVQFDVCRYNDNASRFFLYELYHDAVAFGLHLASDHFRVFDAQTKDWIVEKQVHKATRVAP